MNSRKMSLALMLALTMLAGAALAAVSEPNYKVLKKAGNFEVRQYDSYLVAEVEVKGTFGSAAFQAFGPLFKYIDGNNRSRQGIPMTAPVEQQPAGTKIPMTAPVTQVGEAIPMTAPVTQTSTTGTYAVGFVMPANLTLENVPVPNDPRIKIREVPARTVAVISYSGSWSRLKYAAMEKKRLEQAGREGLETVGAPVFARYDHPGVMTWKRRNEIMVEVKPVGGCARMGGCCHHAN